MHFYNFHNYFLSQTIKTAIELNAKAYTRFSDALRDSDVILLGMAETKLADFAFKLKQMRIRNKIICHMGYNKDSYILACGTTNTCYSIYLPYKYNNPQLMEDSNNLIMFEGNGKRSEEFEDALKKSKFNYVVCTPAEKRLAKIASRIVRIHLKAVITAAIHLLKISGIYDREALNDSIHKMVSAVCEEQKAEKSDIRINADELKQNIKLLGTINSGDMQEYYKNMEHHITECGIYGQTEKIDILRTLGKMPRSKKII